MSRPELAIGHSGAHSAEDDVIAVVCGVDLDLLQAPPGQERRGAADERNKAAVGETRGNADHVLFGDPDVDQAIGKQLLELHEVARADAVVADRDDARIRLSEFGERLGKHLTAIERFDFGCRRRIHQTSSLRASSICSGDGTL
jgi:hypothetical protein